MLLCIFFEIIHKKSCKFISLICSESALIKEEGISKVLKDIGDRIKEKYLKSRPKKKRDLR